MRVTLGESCRAGGDAVRDDERDRAGEAGEVVKLNMTLAEAAVVRNALARHLRVMGTWHPDAAVVSELVDQIALAVLSAAEGPPAPPTVPCDEMPPDPFGQWRTLGGEG